VDAVVSFTEGIEDASNHPEVASKVLLF